MKRALKIIAVVLVLLIMAAAGGALYVWHGVKAVPSFYGRARLEGEARLRAIESFDRKVLNLQSALDLAWVRANAEVPASQPSTRPAGEPAPEWTPGSEIPTSSGEALAVTFTGPELDIYFAKWLEETGYDRRFARYMEAPRLAVQDGRVILAGRMSDFGAIVSLHFLPELNERSGAVQLRLDGIYAGVIPVPRAAFEKFRVQAVDALGEQLPELREDAAISGEGFANREAILVSSQQQLIELLSEEAVQPLIAFLPLPGRGFVPARVTRMSVEEEDLTLEVELLSRAEQAELAEELRDEP